jgi:hypothetical protein
MKNDFETIISNKLEFIRFLKTKSSLFHLSNVFFRDIQYGIMSYADSKGETISYGRAEEVAKLVINNLEGSGILKSIKPGSWMLNFPEFRTPSSKVVPSSSTTKPTATTQSVAGAQSAATGGVTPARTTTANG